ncbi:asparagine synthetase [glutamine-hydrolyzing] 1 [Oxobacter pfennigii]|uniref:asparagine synthase (glutamine-hydrolyzing) n=1 Tax=Oxobacter pfennigii TaxID=36849 RepID=A0A0P8W3U9_9CLOT|nr:asparagine synthase (glutamine-hydrolyzing) [Oxobacter pfennigii]KPU42270.1 asparagine synthetase [glutamine-hydrolyzing] 1 [Oxobacter pfennigii]
MCGFVTIFKDQPLPEDNNTADIMAKMTSIIKHRGPDQEGTFTDEHICLGFRRLSIIDLENGSQPFPYDDGRYQMVFNGEIYNYIELREMLIKEGLPFSTHSDTEVILALYKHMGPESVKLLRGMFAFVIWDRQTQKIFGARDPFGIKPFYYAFGEDYLYCASEKKSLLFSDEVSTKINLESLHHYLTFQFVPEPNTILSDVLILEPGTTIEKELGQKPVINRYWSVIFNPSPAPFGERLKEIKNALEDSVKVHMRSDVPVGAFLSGGIDSTIIVALCAKLKPDIKTFTVGFEREGFSEIDLAKETADKLGVENISKIISAEEFINELPKIIWHMDEPMADPAAVPLYFVAKEARKHVTVVLSGEGSDELFGGYNIYREPLSLKAFSRIPDFAKKLIRFSSSLLPDGVKGKSFLERGCTSIEERYVGNAKIFQQSEKSIYLKDYSKDYSYQKVTEPYYRQAKDYDDVTKMQYIDINTWLRGDILVKADRMTMAHSLELRVPFLDMEVFKAASKLTLDDKIGNSTTKYALREAFRGVIPDAVTTRKKLGFPVPIRHWLKDEMYSWAVNLINESETEQYIQKNMVLSMLEEHRKGPLDYSRKLWTILIFMLWHQIFAENRFSISENLNFLEIENQVAVM